jgi:glycosyltransferase involved in cell wall biosynthesis
MLPHIDSMLKNILVINDFSHVNGGAAQVALSSATGLAQRGLQVTFFSAVGPDDSAAKYAGVTFIRTDQFDVLQDPNRLRAAVQGIWNVRARRQIRNLLRSLDPANTILHFHSWTKALSSSVVREALIQSFTVVFTLHDYFTACPNGGFFDFQTGKSCGETALSLGCIARNCDARSYCQKLWRVARHTVQKTFGKIPGGIPRFISVSDFSERILERYLPASATIDRVPNPIDVVRREPTDVARNSAFVYVGRLAPEKGSLTFASAASHAGVAAVFVGDGPDASRIMSICPRAEITGWLPRSAVTERIRSARSLVMPSLWLETQGLVVSEAAAQGVPTIVSDLCGAKESVADGQTGLWFAGGDTDDLVRRIETMSQPPKAAAFGRNAYDSYWVNPMTLERHVDELIRVFSRYLIERGSAQRNFVP